MTPITINRATVEQALEALVWEAGSEPALYAAQTYKAIADLRAALAQQDEPAQKQDAELSAALGWPGGISNPVLDRKVLLQKVAALRLASQQALEALEWISLCYVGDDDYTGECASCHERSYMPHAPSCKKNNAITALRAALAQQAEPQGCATEEDCTKQPWCRIRGECQRKQAEPVEPAKPVAQQAKPLTGLDMFLDPADGLKPKPYKPRAEPAQEPVAGRAFLERILTAMEGVIDVADRKTDEFDALRSCVIDLTLMLHTAPPQRKPLPKQDQHCVDVPGYGLMAIRLVRAVERAHGIKEN